MADANNADGLATGTDVDTTNKPTDLETQIELVRELKTFSHLILSTETVETYSKAFGFQISCYAQPAEELYEPEGDVMGLCATALAQDLCHRLHVKYERKHGRGSALQECCRKLLIHLESASKKD